MMAKRLPALWWIESRAFRYVLVMKAYVMWSGGLDSTALIWHYLQRGYKVSAGYVAVRANVGKTAAELRAIHQMLPFLEQYAFSFKGVIGWFRWNYGMNDNLHRGPFPIINIIFSAMLDEKFDEIAVGAVKDDKLSAGELKAIFALHRSLRPLQITRNRLVFPLRNRSKKSLLATLPLELRQYLWTCDHVAPRQRKPCGKCHRCQRYQELFHALKDSPVAKPERRARKSFAHA